MKIDDVLICHKYNGSFVKDRKYKVSKISDSLVFLMSNGYEYYFSLDVNSHIYFRMWFSNIKLERLEKLNKLDGI